MALLVCLFIFTLALGFVPSSLHGPRNWRFSPSTALVVIVVMLALLVWAGQA